MKLYLLSQTENTSYDSFDSLVVRASSESEAAKIHPNGSGEWERDVIARMWCKSPDDVHVEHIGKASPTGSDEPIVLASFNAG